MKLHCHWFSNLLKPKTPKRPAFNGCGEGERCPVRGPVTTCSGETDSTCHEVRQGCLVYRLHLGGGFKYFLFSPLFGGRFPIWRSYFSKGLVQPLTRDDFLICFANVGKRGYFWQFVCMFFSSKRRWVSHLQHSPNIDWFTSCHGPSLSIGGLM